MERAAALAAARGWTMSIGAAIFMTTEAGFEAALLSALALRTLLLSRP